MNKQINQAVTIATRFAKINSDAKAADSAIMTVTHGDGYGFGILTEKEMEVLRAAITVLESIQGRTDQHAAMEAIEKLSV